jgi:riboflavin kinase/FMN adenylyltransferase
MLCKNRVYSELRTLVDTGIIFGLENLHSKGYVLTQGTFDGVHRGHQHVLNQVVEEAKKHNLPSMLLTFHPHPRSIVQPEMGNPQILSSIQEKAQRVLDSGIDVVLVLAFTEEISQYSASEFIERILCERIGVKSIVVGYDHRFGKNREGRFENLTALSTHYGFTVLEIAAHEIDDIAISSTRIRRFLSEGDLERANDLLGYYYPLSGEVIHGQKRGRTIGFPTANIQLDEPHKLVPPNGVYAATVTIGLVTYPVVMNIGVRPTVNGTEKSIEAHIIGLDQDLYNQRIQVNLRFYLRKERKFANLELLKEQIQNDVNYAVQILS